MITVNAEKCRGCGICVKNCPLNAVTVKDKVAVIDGNCVSCNICARVCPFGALSKIEETRPGYETCTSCPVNCAIPSGKKGACGRYTNIGGRLVRNRKLVLNAISKGPDAKLPYRPILTGVGSGTTYPCFRPAPYIVQENIEGVDVVTVVTEAPLSYSGVKVKIDTNRHIGEEGAKVKRDGKVVGMVTTEEYGAKMLTIGGANLLSGSNDGFLVARTIVDLANGRRVILKVENGSVLEIQQGKPPVIDGQTERLMRVGCGSATIGMFAEVLAEAADEAIILDYHIIGLLTEHAAGRALGLKYSGIIPYGRKSTNGRYFGKHGHGWGGTEITDPLDAVKEVDMNHARPGMKILVTETTGQKAALLEVTDEGTVKEVPMTEKAIKAVSIIAETCEESKVSVIYTGGTGGSARAGVSRMPKKLTEAVHSGEAVLTIGGAPTFILPGGGINFMVDVSKMVPDSVTWVPTPATVAPVEYTMTREKYEEIGGHTGHIITKEELLKKLESEED
jgi:NAD-dependent dihydropyrimidine dehydrogenase PreA subunit